MKNEQMANALNEIDDRYLADAAAHKPRRGYWIAAVAAVLAIVIAISAIPGLHADPSGPNLDVPGTSSQNDPSGTTDHNQAPEAPDDPIKEPGAFDMSAILALPDLKAAPTFPSMLQYPNRNDYSDDWHSFYEAENAWKQAQKDFYNQPEGYADSLTDFFRRSINEFLSGEENGAYSPVNVYLAMAMLAETTDGNSRQQILKLFGVDSIEQLRTQVNYLWNAHYSNDGQTTLLLANSLWLDDAFHFRQETVDRLSGSYYASVFGGDLGTDSSNAQLQAWLNAMTGGLLEEQTKNVKLSPNTAFALASTIYFKAGWLEEFSKKATKEDVFHSNDGDITTQFMYSMQESVFFRGSNFGAVCLGLTGENSMWIILPDEGVTVAQVLAGEEYMNLTLDPDAWSNKTRCILHIRLPKFDITKQSDLIAGMKNLGITDVFSPAISDFTPMLQDGTRLFVSQINHAARVAIDEEGVIAAAFTVIETDIESVGPTTVIEFTVDRPFAFIVSSRDHLPLFAGVVTKP